ncbi:MAG: hypothetical protein A2133_05250 [Actinobacteria bacterium RBG_16_64_13]|nr:MAG: hypothetical protein A2133_05250 [Actinobacteria bacterium RBG_16_64_13]
MHLDTDDPLFMADLCRAFLFALPDGVMVCSAAGKCLWATEAAARFLGMPHESLRHLHLGEIGALKGSQLAAQGDETMRTGQPCHWEASLAPTNNGSLLLDFRLSRAELLGEPVLIVLISDIGERCREQAATRASVERYRMLVDATSDLIYSYDTALTLTGINRPAARTLGLEPAEAVGRPLGELGFPEPTLSLWKRMTEAVLSSREATREVVEAVMPDGQTYAYETVLQPVLDGSGCVIGCRGASRDVSGMKRVETELRQSEERFRGIFEQGSVGIALIGTDQSLVRANSAFCEMLGYEENELLGKTVADITATEDVQPSLEGSRALYSGERSSLTIEKRYRRKDGGLIWGHLSASLVRGDDGQPFGSVAMVQDITSRKQVEESLRLAEFSVDHAGLAIFWSDPQGRFLSVNDYLCRRLGYSREELLGMTVAEVDPVAPKPWRDHWLELREKGSITFESLMRTRSGEEFPIEGTGNYVEFAGKEYNFGFAVDISERKKAQEALRESEELFRQSHKMEAIGQLAGGIAHDFNNLLTAIIGYSDLVLTSGDSDIESLRSDVREIKAAAGRASDLTRQILAFSRRQALQPEVVSLNDVVSGTERLLGRTLGETIELVTLLRPDLGLVEVDRSQFEQVLMNLVVNARDAMPGGGRLTIETANVELDEKSCRAYMGTDPGPYVLLAVSDTGTGMDEDTRSRAFEPFFTTKEPGRGTGLGLSTVYGIVKQSCGSVYVHSELGRGTTLRVYLPRVDQPKKRRATALRASDSVVGNETILLVEDEAAVRELSTRVLTRLGYHVVAAANGDDAIVILENEDHPYDMLLTDVVLPGTMQGNEVARAARLLNPDLPVLYMSGYTRDAIVHAGRLDEGVNYLEKPFTPDRLAQRVREVLDSRHGAQEAADPF